ncbi:MAG: M20/M25/M40 family metallo-hydrolase, partial [Devosia sp.]|nr:M20/M25/M40 family metallo-hydrolase [Devosia sp.]
MVDPVQLLAALIREPSVTPELHGVFDVLEAALIPLGFTCQRVRFEGDGSYPVDNLFATRGTGGRHLLFAGHTDVVPPGDEAAWRHPPFAAEIVDGTIYGRGAADMKSGIAAFVAAISRAPADGTISLAITNDEEADSVNGTDKLMAWAAAEGHRFDFAIVGEPSATARVGDAIK